MERTAVLGRLKWWVGTVVATVSETPNVRSLVLDVPDWEGHRPGQHVDIRLTAPDGYQAVRSYSISSASRRGRLAITVELLDDGEVSPYLVQEVRVSDSLEFRGPIGGYFVWEPVIAGPLLLVAGGSGIAPLMSMIRYRADVGSDVPTRLLYSSRSPDRVIFADELDHLDRHDQMLEVIHTFTRSQPPGWKGYRRRVDVEMLKEVVWPPEQRPLAYICGPTRFVESVAAGLLTLGYEPARIRTERFGPTGA